MNDILHGEIVRCDCCGCTLDSDFYDLGVCANCVDGTTDYVYEDQDWLDVPTPWLDNDEEDNY